MGNIIGSLLAKVSPIAQAFQQANAVAQAIQSGNPLQLMGQGDDRMKQVYDFINQYGGNAETAFYALAKQKGADPNAALQQVQQFINGNS